MSSPVSRRHFMGGLAAAIGTGAIGAEASGAFRDATSIPQPVPPPRSRPRLSIDEYDAAAKLSYNENPYGPPESVVKAMTSASRFGNRYNYPDANIVDVIAAHHGVQPSNVLLGAGSSEILQVAGRTFLPGGRKVIGVEPTFTDVYEYASGVRAESIILPLRDDYTQDVSAMVRAARANHRDVGFVYVCTPNNPTGIVVSRTEIRQLLDGVPTDVPVLIDEAYHEYVEDRAYATSIPYVLEGRNVIVTRTFSKIYGLAGMRLGYGIAPKTLIDRMRPHCTGSINALVKWAGAAALTDTTAAERVRLSTLQLRKSTVAALEALGYKVLPSETNFFMVDMRRDVAPVIEAFRAKGVLVGRRFPPMVQHLRVSIGTADEMARFLRTFREAYA